jgi:hypothetical protein
MKSKTNLLQQALRQGSGHQLSEDAENTQVVSVGAQPERGPRKADRTGKKNISVWLDAAYNRSMLLVQAATGRNKQQLFAEALNDLFAKYNAPQIRDD